MRLILILLFFFGQYQFAIGQDYVDNNIYTPPSPNAQGLLKYSSVPVSLHTGTPIIQLPITELKGRNLSIPVSLSYHASGIKVQDIASWVGLGWSLNAGGVITRVIRGLPDENPNGFAGVNNIGEKSYQALTKEYVTNVNGNYTWDGEPDLFYFNFMGNVGMFILDEMGNPILLPHSNLKISPAVGQKGNGKWVIKTPDGIAYTFGVDSNSRETTTSKTTGSTTSLSFISSWYLTEIKDTKGEVITFTYSTGKSINYKYYVQVKSKIVKSWGLNYTNCVANNNDIGIIKDQNIEVSVTSTKYLSHISSTIGKLIFTSLEGREDLTDARYLSQIKLLDYNNNFITGFKFDYSYHISDGCSTELCKRLKLVQIFKITNGVTSKLYSFDYNTVNLPSRDSHSIDHWGYYNSNVHSSKIPTVNDPNIPCDTNHPGADRSADSLRSMANILTKIYRSSGGYTEFFYQPHHYLDEQGFEQIAGGARVRLIKDCVNSVCSSKYYYYKNVEDQSKTSGNLSDYPKYTFISESETYYVGPYGGFSSGKLYLITQSQSLNNLFDLNGYHVGYSNVEEKEYGNGFSRYYFTSYNDHADVDPVQFSYRINYNGSSMVGASMSPNVFPYTPKTSKSWERGLLLKKEIFSDNAKLLQKEEYTYKFDLAAIKTINAYKFGRQSVDFFGYYLAGGKYQMISRPYIMEKKTLALYDQNSPISDETKFFKRVQEYSYNITNLLPTKIIDYNASQPSYKNIIRTKYATDFSYSPSAPVDCQGNYNACLAAAANEPDPQVRAYWVQDCDYQLSSCSDSPGGANPSVEASAIQTLITNYEIATPIEVLSYSEDNGVLRLNSSLVNKFKFLSGSSSVVVPSEVWSTNAVLSTSGTNQYTEAEINPINGNFEVDYRLKKRISYDSYDPVNGNLLQQTGEDGTVRSFAWSHRGSLLSSTIINPGTDQFATSFEHKPLIGITEVTDLNSRNISYGYDLQNRLKTKKDHDGNILEYYKSKSVSEWMNAGIAVNGLQVVNGSLKFTDSGTGDFPVGNTSYNWNFGDGIQSNGTAAVNHTYTSAGSYIVQLTKNNTEYGVSSASIVVTIAPGPSISICVDGPVYIDLCGTNPSLFGDCTAANNSEGSTIQINAAVLNGCSNNTYSWYYNNGNGWSSFGYNSPSVNFPFFNAVGSYEVRCQIIDGCGNEVTSSSQYISFYKSNADCNGQIIR